MDISLSLKPFLIFIAISLGIFFILKIIFKLVISRLQKVALSTENKWDDFFLVILTKTSSLFLLSIIFYIGSHSYELELEKFQLLIDRTFLVITVLQVAIWGHHLISEGLHQILKSKEQNKDGNPVYNVIRFTLNLILFVTLFLFILSNFGVNVSALVTGLGVGGIAIALAVQNILGDLFASITIALDKPFNVGDYVVLDTFMGHIEKIGIKTTRIRSLTGEEIVVSNADLLKSKIRNYERINRRRVAFEFGVTYETKHDHLKEIPNICEGIIKQLADTEFERCHFRRLGEYALIFEVVYWINHKEHSVQLDRTQSFNLKIIETFNRLGIEFAYPTQMQIKKN